jgi:transglutaminase-like putative cysteine protease
MKVKERREMKRFDVEKAIEYSKRFKKNSNQLLSVIAYFVNEMLTQSIVDEAEKVDPDPIIEVYKEYKNYISDSWFNGVADETLRKWWQAITKYAEGKGKV